MRSRSGFSLVEVVVACALFAIVAGFVTTRRGEVARQTKKKDQFVRMHSIKDYTYLDTAFNPHNFIPDPVMAYYACYNRGGGLMTNHFGEVGYGLVPKQQVEVFRKCMEENKTSEKTKGTCQKDVPKVVGGGRMCPGATFIVFAELFDNAADDAQQVKVIVTAVNPHNGRPISWLRMKGTRNSGY